jgi:hypothetical protein
MDEGSQQTPSVDETNGTPTSASTSTTSSLLTAQERTTMPRKAQHALRKLRLAKKVLTDTSLREEFEAVSDSDSTYTVSSDESFLTELTLSTTACTSFTDSICSLQSRQTTSTFSSSLTDPTVFIRSSQNSSASSLDSSNCYPSASTPAGMSLHFPLDPS